MRIGNIEVLKDGLTINGHRYEAGDVLPRAHHTHDVVQAADQKAGALKGWVRRVKRATPAERTAAAKAKSAEATQSAPAPADQSAGHGEAESADKA